MCLCCVCRLHSFLMQVANASVQGNHRASAVEVCSCPVGYAGTSCEVCSGHASQHVSSFSELSLSCFCVIQACVPGFRRVNGKLYNGVCAACHCHGHASQCHEVTGHCLVRPGFSFCLWSPTSTHRCGFQLNKEILHLFLCGWCRQRLDYFGKINIAFKPAFLRKKSLVTTGPPMCLSVWTHTLPSTHTLPQAQTVTVTARHRCTSVCFHAPFEWKDDAVVL